MKQIVIVVSFLAITVCNTSCGYFGKTEVKDNRAEAICRPDLDRAKCEKLIEIGDELPPEERDQYGETFKNLTNEELDMILEAYELLKQLTPEERKRFIHMKDIKIGDLNALKKGLAVLRKFKEGAIQDQTQQEAVYQDALHCMSRSRDFNGPNSDNPKSNMYGMVPMIPPNYIFPSNPDMQTKFGILTDIDMYIRGTGHMWPAHSGKWIFENRTHKTDWFIQYGFVAHQEMVIFVTYRATIWKGNHMKVGVMGNWGKEHGNGSMEWKLVAVDPTNNCRVIDESEPIREKVKANENPWIFTVVALPTPETIDIYKNAKANRDTMPDTPVRYNVVVVNEAIPSRNRTDRDVFDIITVMQENMPKNEIMYRDLEFNGFEIGDSFKKYYGEKYGIDTGDF